MSDQPPRLSSVDLMRARNLWRAGRDTVDIADALGFSEADIVASLWLIRSPQRGRRA